MIKLLFLYTAFLSFGLTHPLHLSVTNLDYSEAEQTCHLIVKVFSDDFADEIRSKMGVSALGGRDTLQITDSVLFQSYLADHIQIRIDGQQLPMEAWTLDSVRNNFEASWMFYSLHFTGAFEEISFGNSLFFTVFADQKNLVIIARNREEKAFQLNHRKPQVTVRY